MKNLKKALVDLGVDRVRSIAENTVRLNIMYTLMRTRCFGFHQRN